MGRGCERRLLSSEHWASLISKELSGKKDNAPLSGQHSAIFVFTFGASVHNRGSLMPGSLDRRGLL